MVMWVDGNIDLENEDCQDTLVQLRDIVSDITLCTEAAQCITFLNDIHDEKAFVISSGSIGQHLVPHIHDMPQLDAIYIFCRKKERHEVWAKNWTKIKGIHTSIKSICKALKIAVKQCNQENLMVSVISVNNEGSGENLNQLEPSFMYFQILKEILLDMQHDQQAAQELVTYCQQEYQDNIKELKLIDEFQRTYHPKLAISWYTRQCFIYTILNRALRTLDGNIIIRMGFYLCDLYRQIGCLHNIQVSQGDKETFVVYRGQGLSTTDFDKVVENKNGFISFNNFLSTSKNPHVSLQFAKNVSETTNMVGILFKMTIDPTTSSTPFASTANENYYAEDDEILFSLHTVFRIGDIQKLDDNLPLYKVDLTLISDDDQQFLQLTDVIREEIRGTGWYRMGHLLLKTDQFDKAEELYITLLEQTSDDSNRAYIYKHLGWIKQKQEEYKEAASFYEKFVEINRKTLPIDNPSLANIYSNIGEVYKAMGDYSKALEFYKESLEINENTLPSNHLSLGISYDNIGQVYKTIGDYSKALEFYEKAFQIYEEVLLLNDSEVTNF
ncbi:unnamed protein product [Rotaria sp. Silwood1]|nr:unnamed protein product [Rotaria sp. Silwood1]